MATVNITVQNDADFIRTFQWVKVDTGEPINITGAVMTMMLRRHAEDQVALLRLGTDTGEIVLSDAINGKFTITIRQPVLERLGLGDFDHSLIASDATTKHRVWSGTLTNNAGPTR